LALFLAGKPFQGILNLILWLIAIVFAITVLGFIVGFVLWVVCDVHAIFVMHSVKADERNKALIDAMKDKG
jgi:FtsH-binding integral membrane protein